ncbi:MAG: hypothetical protein GF335_02915 [Candidatus Moranbacteria bacterium]|nr:hypothetical protein [Candidatus Moranbacteria bacterium]
MQNFLLKLNLKKGKINSFLFNLILFLLPFQGRFFFETPFSYFDNTFIEYNSFYITTAEILIFILIIFNLALFWKSLCNLTQSNKYLMIILVLFCLVLLNLLNSINIFISLHKYFHLSLWLMFAWFGLKHFVNWQRLINSAQVILFSAFFQSIFVVVQFFLQKSINSLFARESVFSKLFKMTGESVLAKDIIGVSKILEDGEIYIRAYGTQPHPNILGAYLFFALIIIFYYAKNLENNHLIFNNLIVLRLKRFFKLLKSLISRPEPKTIRRFFTQKELIFPRKLPDGSFKLKTQLIYRDYLKLFRPEQTDQADSNFKILNNKYHKLEINLLRGLAVLFVAALLLTFSRGALLGLLIVFLYLFITKYLDKLLLPLITAFFVLLMLLSPFYINRAGEKVFLYSGTKNQAPQNKKPVKTDLTLRGYYKTKAKKIISGNLFFGIGAGNFVYFELKNNDLEVSPLFLQPVHNIFLLGAGEFGIILFSFLIYFLTKALIEKSKRVFWIDTGILKTAIIIFVIVLGMFDHYFLSFSQGISILTVLILFFASSSFINKNVYNLEQLKRRGNFSKNYHCSSQIYP